MESLKLLNLLNKACDSKFLTIKWNNVYDQSNTNYALGKENICSTEALKSYFCDQNDNCILVRGIIAVKTHNEATQVAFKDCGTFTKCITKIDGTAIDEAGDLDWGMLIYHLLEYS